MRNCQNQHIVISSMITCGRYVFIFVLCKANLALLQVQLYYCFPENIITRKLYNYTVVTRIINSVVLLNTQDFSFIRLIACSICDLPSKLSYLVVAVSLISLRNLK
jgi:hypothetical protein